MMTNDYVFYYKRKRKEKIFYVSANISYIAKVKIS